MWIHKLQLIQTTAVRALTETRRMDLVSPTLRRFHSSPVHQRTDLKKQRVHCCIQTRPEGVGKGSATIRVFSAKTVTQVRIKTEDDGDSTGGHLHHFSVKFSRSDRYKYHVGCDQPRTVLEVIKSTEKYKKMKNKKGSDENIVIQLGKEDKESIVATHFPCCGIKDGETVIISWESQQVEDAQNQHVKTIHTRNKYSVFYIDTVGGKNTKTKELFRNNAVKKFKYLCVYGEKGMTVEEALRNDGRFIENLGDFTLSDNENPNCIIERTQKVDNLDQRAFKLCLPRNMRTNYENLQNNPGGCTKTIFGQAILNTARLQQESIFTDLIVRSPPSLHARLNTLANRPLLPSLLLANVRSLENKVDELRARITSQREVRDCCALIIIETWLSESVPDSAIQLQSHSTHRGDRTAAAGKTKGGGVCIFVNNTWCGAVQTVHKCCTPDIEMLLLKCRPLYLPREFSAVFLAAVYIAPRANPVAALGILHDIISTQETAHPDAAFIIGGDFNHCNLRTVLPKFYQHVNIPTREQSTLDHVYTNIQGAYRAAPRPHFGLSDHISVFLYPVYRQRLNQTNPMSSKAKR